MGASNGVPAGGQALGGQPQWGKLQQGKPQVEVSCRRVMGGKGR